MIVKVSHFENGKFVPVANINARTDDVNVALEYAWRRTNNIDGSWSRGPEVAWNGVNLEPNPDYHEDIQVLAPLPTHFGKVYGIRSSMVGDVFTVEGKLFVVANCGFQPYEG